MYHLMSFVISVVSSGGGGRGRGGGDPLKLLSRRVIHNLHFYKTVPAARWEIGRQGKHLGKPAGSLSKME